MNFILGYIVAGVVALLISMIIAAQKVTGLPFKEVMKEFIHPVIYVLIWPIDMVLILHTVNRYPNEFKGEISEELRKYCE